MKGLLKCPEPSCDAVYLLVGDFFNNQGQIQRLSSKPSDSCARCKAISDENGGVL